MTVSHIEVIVEEPSTEAALRILLPRLLTAEQSFEVYSHRCKDELLQRLPERLRGYAEWLPKDWRMVVLLDRDDDDCRALKRRLDTMARDAGLVPRSGGTKGYQVVNRLAIEELEAWFFGDWQAVTSAYPRVNAKIGSQARTGTPMPSPVARGRRSSGCCKRRGTSRRGSGRSRRREPSPSTWIRPGTRRAASARFEMPCASSPPHGRRELRGRGRLQAVDRRCEPSSSRGLRQ